MPNIEVENKILAEGKRPIVDGEPRGQGCPGAHPDTRPTPEKRLEKPYGFHIHRDAGGADYEA